MRETVLDSPVVRASDVFRVLYDGVDGLVELRSLPSKARAFIAAEDVAGAAAFVTAHKHEHLYFGVATRRDASSGTLENCVQLPALFTDVDFKSGDETALRGRILDAALPPTLVIESGGGLHCYWKLQAPIDPTEAQPWLRRLARHLGGDLAAAEGARILRLPNTLNHKYDPARRVTVTHLDTEASYSLTDLDAWLPAGATPSTPGALFSADRTITNGGRNTALYTVARKLVASGLQAPAVEAAIGAANATQCDPPLPDREVAAIVQHAIVQPDRSGFVRQSLGSTTTPDTLRLLDDHELESLPDPEFIIDGMFQERSVGVIYSPPNVGKTTLMAALAVSLGLQRPWNGHAVTRPSTTIYVGAEDSSGWKARLRAAKRQAGMAADARIPVFTFPEPIDLCDPTSVALFEAFILGQRDRFPVPLGMTFIDTYAAVTRGAVENSAEDTTTAMGHARRLSRALDCTIVLAHHTNAAGTRERGHSAMRGDADTMIALNPVDDLVEVELNKQRNGATGILLTTLKLVPDPDGAGMVFRPISELMPSARLSPAQDKALRALRDTFAMSGATKGEWLKVCVGMAERTFYHATKQLAEHGYVTQVGTTYRPTGKEPA